MYVTEDGKILHSDIDFEGHKNLNVTVDVEELDGDGVLTTGLISYFDEKVVTINEHLYNRHAHLFVSRPLMSP